jgi:hypothetical protein
LPTRAHFLISAQCSLVERVHDRMKGILNAMNRPAGPSVLVREEAVV